MKVDKAQAQGTEALIPREEWCSVAELHGTDADVIRHPIMERAFSRILQLHKPQHPVALLSLCTSTRPYSTSFKWKRYIAEFGSKADLVITSNGGVIPITYESAFPFLNYDAHGHARFDTLYVHTLTERLLRFFRACRYDYALFAYNPTIRNCRAALRAGAQLKAEGTLKDYAILPSKAFKERWSREELWHETGKFFLEAHSEVLWMLHQQLRQWSRQEESPCPEQ